MNDILVPLVAILVGGAIVFVPIAGITARLALKPLVEAWSRLRESPVAEDRMRLFERRIALLEDQVQMLERENTRLAEAADFQLRLGNAGEEPHMAVSTFEG